LLHHGGAAVLPAAGLALLKAAAAFGVAVLLARLVVGPLFDLIARARKKKCLPRWRCWWRWRQAGPPAISVCR
jgi:hypothetical protein